MPVREALTGGVAAPPPDPLQGRGDRRADRGVPGAQRGRSARISTRRIPRPGSSAAASADRSSTRVWARPVAAASAAKSTVCGVPNTRSKAPACSGAPCSSRPKIPPPPSLSTTIVRSGRGSSGPITNPVVSCSRVRSPSSAYPGPGGRGRADRGRHRPVDARDAPVGQHRDVPTRCRRERHVADRVRRADDEQRTAGQRVDQRPGQAQTAGRARGVECGVERQRHPGERRDRFHDLDEGIERAAHQRRHADEKAEGNGHGHGQQIADQDPGDRIGELDADALVVGAAVVERVLEVLPDLGADLGGTRHGGLALRGGDAHQLGILGSILTAVPLPPVRCARRRETRPG